MLELLIRTSFVLMGQLSVYYKDHFTRSPVILSGKDLLHVNNICGTIKCLIKNLHKYGVLNLTPGGTDAFSLFIRVIDLIPWLYAAYSLGRIPYERHKLHLLSIELARQIRILRDAETARVAKQTIDEYQYIGQYRLRMGPFIYWIENYQIRAYQLPASMVLINHVFPVSSIIERGIYIPKGVIINADIVIPFNFLDLIEAKRPFDLSFVHSLIAQGDISLLMNTDGNKTFIVVNKGIFIPQKFFWEYYNIFFTGACGIPVEKKDLFIVDSERFEDITDTISHRPLLTGNPVLDYFEYNSSQLITYNKFFKKKWDFLIASERLSLNRTAAVEYNNKFDYYDEAGQIDVNKLTENIIVKHFLD